MFRATIYSFLISIIIASNANTSVYLNVEAAQEGLRRGQTESFASPVGRFSVDDKDGTNYQFNGVLIHPSLVLTNRHTIKGEKFWKDGSFCAYPNAQQFYEKISSSTTSIEEKTALRGYGARLDLNQIYLHPNEDVDLAIVKLIHPLTQIKPLSLLLSKPKNWGNGYFVSYAPVYTLNSGDEVIEQYKRHIAILDVTEESVHVRGIQQQVLIKNWELAGDVSNPSNREYIPQEGMHRLTAFTQPSDSGAGFVVKNNQYLVAGIHRGRSILTEETDEKDSKIVAVSSMIIPLYPYKDWIEGILRKM